MSDDLCNAHAVCINKGCRVFHSSIDGFFSPRQWVECGLKVSLENVRATIGLTLTIDNTVLSVIIYALLNLEQKAVRGQRDFAIIYYFDPFAMINVKLMYINYCEWIGV